MPEDNQPSQIPTPQMEPNAGIGYGYPRVCSPPAKFVNGNIKEFLCHFERYADWLGWNSELKTECIVNYVAADVAELILIHPGATSGNWEEIKNMLLSTYCKKIVPKSPRELLSELLKKGFDYDDPETFLLRYTAITNCIGDMSGRDKAEKLFEILDVDFKERCMIHLGREFTYDELKNVILDLKHKSKMIGRPLCSKEISNQGRENNQNQPSLMGNEQDFCERVTKIVLQAVEERDTSRRHRRQLRCLYCDDKDHVKPDCKTLTEDLQNGIVRIVAGKVAYPNGEPIPLNTGKGGMRSFITEGVKVRHISLHQAPKQAGYDLLWEDAQVSEAVMPEILSEEQHQVYLKRARVGAAAEKSQAVEIDTREAGTMTEKAKRAPPAYHYRAPVEEDVESEEVIDKVLKETPVTLKLEELLAVAPNARKKMSELVSRKRIPVNPQTNSVTVTSDVKQTTEIMSVVRPTATVTGMVAGHQVDIAVDPGSEINVMSGKFYERACKLPLDTSRAYSMGNASGTSTKARGLCHNVPIVIGSVSIPAHVMVVDGTPFDALVGMPWLEQAQWEIKREDSGSWYLLREGCNSVRFPAAPLGQERADGNQRSQLRANWITLTQNESQVDTEEEVLGVVTVREFNDDESTMMTYAAKYKPVGKKKLPIAVPVPTTEEPEAVTEVIKRTKRRLTDERIAKMVIGDEKLRREEVQYFTQQLRTVDQAFAFEDDEMGMLRPEVEPPVRIPTIPHEPWYHRSIPIPRAIFNKVVELLRQKMESGVIESSSGAYSNRWFVIAKKDKKKLRFIQDLQQVNSVTIKNANVPPLSEELIEDVSGRSIISTFDLYSGYDQIPVDVRDRDVFSLNTPIGLVRMTRLPMGWCNSVGIFQRIVNKVLGRHMPEKVAIFVDDGVVKGSVEADQTEVLPGVRRYVYDHVQDVVDVMKTLIQAGLTVSGTKCKFGMEEVEVLGYQCTPQGRTVTKEKADKIKNWPVPTNKTEVRSFVACCAFYRPLIQHFSIIADPLYHLQKKSVPFYWNESQQHSFVELKLRISSYPVIQPPNYSDATRPLILTVDASPIGAGAVLGQENEERVRYVVKYESCLFNSTQRRYAQIKRELYGLYQMVKKLRKYVHGVHFIIETDARSVIGMLKKPDLPNDAASRWVAYLTMFDYEIRHIPGNKNVVADALSRTTLDEQEQSSSEDEAELWNYKIVNLDDDEEIGVNTVNQVSVERSQEKSYYHLLHYLSKGYMAPSATEAERRRVRAQAKKFFIHEELLFKRDKRGMPKRVIALPAEQVRIVSLIHQGHPFAHRGVEATYRLCSNRFYWNGMYETCKEVVKRCDACQRNSRHMEVEELKPFIGSTLFKRIGVDLMKMPRSEDGMEYLAVARDDFSGWVEAKALAQNTGQEVYKFLYEEVICRFGIPGEVIADRGELHSKKVQEAAKKNGIVLHFTTAYHPQTNGMVERGHQELKKGLAKLVGEDVAKWSKYLHAILWADRITTKRTTGRSPYQLVYGQNCVLPFDIEEETWLTIPWKANMSTDELLAARAQQLLVNAWVREEAGVKLDKSRQQNKQYYDDKKNVRKRKLEEGDMVLMRNRRIIKRHDSKLEVKWKGPYKIVDCPARGVYRLAELDGTIMKSNISGHRIKRYFAPIASATN